MSRPDHSCDSHSPGTSACYYNDQCRCFPCSVEGSRYARKVYHGETAKVDVRKVAATIRRIIAAGWTYRQIAADTGVSTPTLYRIVNGVNTRGVYRRTAEALEEFEAEIGRVLIDARPLVAALRATDDNIKRLIPDDADRRAFYRAEQSGRITEKVADRLAVRALGEPLMVILGEAA